MFEPAHVSFLFKGRTLNAENHVYQQRLMFPWRKTSLFCTLGVPKDQHFQKGNPWEIHGKSMDFHGITIDFHRFP